METDPIVDARNRKYRKCEQCGKNRKAEVRASRSANRKKCAGNSKEIRKAQAQNLF